MSSSLLNNLSEAQIAQLLKAAGITGKAGKDLRPIVKASGFQLIRELNNRIFAEGEVVFDKSGIAAQYEDGSQITFGDLKNCRKENAVRADGSVGTDYPLIWTLTQSECSAAIDWLKAKPQRPKDANRPKAGNKKSAEPKAQNDDRLARLEALVLQLAEGQFANPAKPEPAVGHRKAPAKPVATEADIEDVMSEVDSPKATAMTQVIDKSKMLRIDGELFWVTKGDNGRPYLKKA